MSYYQSVSAWLKQLRSEAVSYEPFAIYTTPSSEGADKEVGDEVGGMTDLAGRWRCGVAGLRFGEERCVSVLFEEEAEDLRVPAVIYEVPEWDVGEDVMLWRQELRFDCEEEENVLENEVMKMLSHRGCYWCKSRSARREKFPWFYRRFSVFVYTFLKTEHFLGCREERCEKISSQICSINGIFIGANCAQIILEEKRNY